MPIDFTQYYGLRKPKTTDDVDLTDFNCVFSANQDIIDAEMNRLSGALSALENSVRLLGNGGNAPVDLSAVNAAISGIEETLSDCETRIGALERSGVGGATTLADYFNAADDDTVTYPESAPVSNAGISSNLTLAGFFGVSA